MVVACVALAVALSGTGIAASAALAPNSVGTSQLRNNAVVTSKVKNGTLVKADFRAGEIPAGLPGPAGAVGPPGPKGDKGDAAAVLWASVDDDGTLKRNKGAVSAVRESTGRYQVVFNQDVSGCVYTATLGGPTSTLWLGDITVAQQGNNTATVTALTWLDPTGLED
jgi:hypothetical protein